LGRKYTESVSVLCGALCCSVALQDALQLARRLEALARQQQQQQQRQQQQLSTKRTFGSPSAAYGVLLDLPDAWWAAFPHKRRLMRQQQQQQQQQDAADTAH